jgi:hypothetical protein
MQQKSCNAEQAAGRQEAHNGEKNKGVAQERAHPIPSRPGVPPMGGPAQSHRKLNLNQRAQGGRPERATNPSARKGGRRLPPLPQHGGHRLACCNGNPDTVVRARCGVPSNHVSQPPALALAAARNTECPGADTARMHFGAPGQRHGATGGALYSTTRRQGGRPTQRQPLHLTRRGVQALPDLPLTLPIPADGCCCRGGGLAGGTPSAAAAAGAVADADQPTREPRPYPAAGRRRLSRGEKAGGGGRASWLGGGAARPAPQV